MAQYNPRTVFRQTSNPLLREFFESKGHHIDVDWNEIGNTQIQGVYEAFLKLSDADRRDLEIELHDIHTVAQSDDGIRILVENAVFMGHDIAGELEASDSRYDKAMIVLLRYPQVWDKAVTLVHADNLSKRCWYRRNTLPKQAPDISKPAMDMLIRDISAFYWQAQGRGQHCQIDHIQRSENQDYFFVYLSDHANTDLVLNETGEFQRVRRRCAFEVVFVFDRSMGVMDVFAHGGRQVIEPLQEIFAKAVIGVDLDPEDPEIHYWVEGLKDRSFQFVTDPADGKAILAQVREDIINGLEYYLDTLDYLLDASRAAEPGDLEHQLFFIAPEDRYVAESIREQVDRLLASLLEDTIFTVEGQTSKWFELSNSNDRLSLELTEDTFGMFKDGDIYVSGDNYSMEFWDVIFEVIDNQLYGYADYGWYHGHAGSWLWVSGYFEGTFNESRTAISNAFFDYWGDINGKVENLSGQVEWHDIEDPLFVDLNPILGGTSRYPDPLSPQDLVCEFGEWNKPIPGTIGHGLGGDPTLGGILPEATDQTWQEWIDPQPTGKLPWPLLETWQMVGGWPMFWLDDQLLFTDSLNDTDEEMDNIPGVDIHRLYMGFDLDYLYGCILLKDVPTSDYCYEYSVALSPSPKSNSALDTVAIRIGYLNGSINGKLYHRDLWDGFSEWFYIDEVEVWLDENWLTFKIPIVSLPCSVSGRYFSVDSYWGYDEWWLEDADLNHTHLQVGQTGSISGEVVFAGHRGGPIFVRAFTDLRDPDESLVAYTVLDEPGAFLLENVGLGLRCYIEAFSPLFGDYHPLDMSALKSTTNRLVLTKAQTVSGIVLNLDVPTVLQNGIWQSGQIDFPLKRDQYFAFDAIAGADYTFELEHFGMSNAYMTILDRNGNDELMQGFSWQLEPIYWTCLVNGRYYVRISEPEWSTESGEFFVRITTNLECPDVDISGSQWAGVRDCRVDFYDFALLASYWMQDCSEPYWCEDSDYTQSGTVNITDLSELLDDWLTDGLLNELPE